MSYASGTLIWKYFRSLKSSSDWLNYTGFSRDVCVACFNVPGNKNAVRQTLLKEKKERKTAMFTTDTSACQDQLNAEFQKYVKNVKFAA